MDKRKLFYILGFGLIVFSLPLTIFLVKHQRDQRSHAAAPDQLEAEGGVLGGNAVVQTDTQASGGQYVLFGGFSITSGPTSQSVTANSVEITWILSESATGQVEYGTTNAYGTLSSPENSFTYSTHIQTLSGLTPSTTYHYRVKSTNQAGTQVVSGDKTFTTTGSLSAGGVYGMGIGGDGLANTPLGGPYLTNTQYMRFRAGQSSNLTAFRFYYLGPPEPGYADGTGGTWNAGVYADDGSADHLPTGSPLAAVTNVPAQVKFSGEAGRLITLTTPVPVTAGNLYHLVFTNTDSSPSTNYFSPDFWYRASIPDRAAGTTPYPSQIHPLMPNSDWGHGYKFGSQWTIREGYLPVLDLTYANGKHQGWSYAEASYGGVDEVGEISGTTKMVREQITVSGSNKTVTGAGIRLLKIAGGTSPLTVKLEDGSGNPIDSFTIPAGNIPNGPAPDFTSPISNDDVGQNARWVNGVFSTSHVLTVGQTYQLTLSTAAGTTYWAWVNRRLQSYGYDPATYFSDGVAQYTRDGSSWSNLGRSKGDQDLQFYLTK